MGEGDVLELLNRAVDEVVLDSNEVIIGQDHQLLTLEIPVVDPVYVHVCVIEYMCASVCVCVYSCV